MLFVASICARCEKINIVTVYHIPFAIEAKSNFEAEGKALQCCEELFPLQSYTNHHVRVIELKDCIINDPKEILKIWETE